MKILAVEFSSEQRSVAVAEKPASSPTRILGEAFERGGRTTHAISLVEKALSLARFEREEIDVIAVGIGPGSYTGIRAAIALAQGWQLARGTKILGISSMESLAAQSFAKGNKSRANFVIDAQRDEFYLAAYTFERNRIEEIEPLHLASLADVQRRLSEQQLVFGPSVSGRIAGACDLFPGAAMLAQLTAERTDYVSGEMLEPIYLRETNFVKAPVPRML